jgi:hypothetical protein
MMVFIITCRFLLLVCSKSDEARQSYVRPVIGKATSLPSVMRRARENRIIRFEEISQRPEWDSRLGPGLVYRVHQAFTLAAHLRCYFFFLSLIAQLRGQLFLPVFLRLFRGAFLGFPGGDLLFRGCLPHSRNPIS